MLLSYNYFEPNMLQSPKLYSIEDSEADNRLKKKNFAGLVKDTKSVAGFSLSRQFRVGRNDVT